MRAAATLALVLAAGCRDERPAKALPRDPGPTPDDLATVIRRDLEAIGHAGDPRATAAAIVDEWELREPAWSRLVTAAFRPHHAAYEAAFEAAREQAIDELIARRPPPPEVAARVHYADDPALAPDQARLRVALPVGRPGAIVTVGGHPLAPIFVHDGRRWRALLGLDRVVTDRIAAGDEACVAPYRAAQREPCLAMSAPIITAALTGDASGLERACARLRGACPTR